MDEKPEEIVTVTHGPIRGNRISSRKNQDFLTRERFASQTSAGFGTFPDFFNYRMRTLYFRVLRPTVCC
jgi:hypothetical protein